jgi:integrase
MASLVKRPESKFWIACFTDASGRQLKRSTKLLDKKEAMKLAIQFESAADGAMSQRQAVAVIGDLMAAQRKPLPSVTVEDWVNQWVSRREKEVSLSTYHYYESSGRKWVEWLGARAKDPLSDQTATTLIEFRDAMAKRITPVSVNHRIKAIGMMLRAARQERLLDENPMDFVKPLKINRNPDERQEGRQPFTTAQIKAVLQVCDPEWKSMVLCAAYTGQRLADIGTLTWDKVDMVAKTISLKTRKTARFQTLPLAPALYNHLVDWTQGMAGRNTQVKNTYRDYLHPRAAGCILRTRRASQLSNQFSRILYNAGLREKEVPTGKGRETKRNRHALSFHSFRHTATSWMKAAGIPASVVMDFIGHDDVAMSRLYTHTGEDAMRVAADSMPNL